MYKNNYKISYHAKQRLIQRGINPSLFLRRDLSYSNVKFAYKEGNTEIRYTKGYLKVIIRDNTVITVMKARPHDIIKAKELYKAL